VKLRACGRVGSAVLAVVLSRGAVGVPRCEVSEGSLACEDLVAEVEEVRGGADGSGDDTAVGVLRVGLLVVVVVGPLPGAVVVGPPLPVAPPPSRPHHRCHECGS
jgi:hypothetical protein